MKAKNKIYTSSDFARYHAGSMSSAEMYALEKAALEDPFLADALEGYVYSNFPEKDITELRRRLADGQKKKKVFFISSVIQNKWWSVAALFIIILGVGYLFYSTNNNNVDTEQLLAKNADKKTLAKAEATSPVLIDSGTINDDVAFQKQEAPGFSLKNKSALPKTPTITEYEKVNKEPSSKIVTAPGLLSTVKDNPVADSVILKESANEIDAAKEYILKGKVTDETGRAIPYASIKDEGQKKITVTDTSGRFALVTRDSSAKVIASAVGYASKGIMLQKDKQPTISMNKSEADLSEVAIAKGRINKRKEALSPASTNLEGRVAGVDIKPTIQPFSVSEEFTQYLKENLIPVHNANNEPFTGEVLLSFNINKKGRPQNIRILKSTCKSCEEQAIRLLENGPDWPGKKNVTGTVEIKF